MSAQRLWLEVDGERATVFYRGAAPPAAIAAGALPLPLLARVGTIRRPLSVPGLASAETASVAIDLDNASGEVSRRFADHPPIRATARVMSAAGVLFSGVVTRVSLAESASLTIEAGVRAPLTDTVPLRTSVVWGGYKEVRPLPVVYGRAVLSPVPYDATGRRFVLADHAIEGVDKVTRDDAPTTAWAFSNGVDSTGQAVAFLELALPLAEGERLAVSLRGKRHAGHGRLLLHPAEILHDLLAQVCGCPLDWARLDRFRAQTAALAIGGVIADPARSIRQTVDELLLSVGAAWSAGADEVAMLYPGEVPVSGSLDAPGALPVGLLTAHDLAAEAAHEGIVTALRVVYDYDHAAGKPRRALALACPEAIRRYGRIEREWGAGWLRSPRDAQRLGERLLGQMARPRWRVRWQAMLDTDAGGARTAQPGGLALLDHARSPLAGLHRLLSADIDPEGLRVECAVEAPVGESPRIVTTALSTAFEPLLQTGASVEYRDGQALFTLLDEAGQAIAGASVTLDGAMTRQSDAHGRVSFPAARGRHTVHVEATGYAPMDIEVTL